MTLHDVAQTTIAPDPAEHLAIVQRQVLDLADPADVVDQIAVGLDRLFDGGADPGVLNAIEDGARGLLEHARSLHDNAQTAIELARVLREQREAARKTLEDLKRAMDEVDRDVPEIDALADAIEEMSAEWMWEVQEEDLIWSIANNTPLTFMEAAHLYEVFTESGLANDHPLWNELREWLVAVRREEGRSEE